MPAQGPAKERAVQASLPDERLCAALCCLVYLTLYTNENTSPAERRSHFAAGSVHQPFVQLAILFELV